MAEMVPRLAIMRNRRRSARCRLAASVFSSRAAADARRPFLTLARLSVLLCRLVLDPFRSVVLYPRTETMLLYQRLGLRGLRGLRNSRGRWLVRTCCCCSRLVCCRCMSATLRSLKGSSLPSWPQPAVLCYSQPLSQLTTRDLHPLSLHPWIDSSLERRGQLLSPEQPVP